MNQVLSGPTTCFSCGRQHRGIYAVGCANDSLKACAECFVKYGAKALQLEGDRLLAEFFALHMQPKSQRDITLSGNKCRHCGKKSDRLVLGLWCDDCEEGRGRATR